MTPQEQQLLQDLTNRINQTVLPDKDPEAEQYLTQSLGRNPDALYILAQTVLVQNYALDQAKKQLEDTRQQLADAQQAPPPPPVKHTSFLGSLLGTDHPAPPPPPPPQPQYGQPQYGNQYAPVPNYPPPGYAQPQYGQPQYAQPGFGAPQYGPPQGGSGFLGSALRTAGGVAAGALAFEGIESLMHGFGEHAGYGGGSGFGEMGGGGRPEEVINNYYGDSNEHEHGGISRDIEDRRDDNDDKRGFADTDNDDNNSDDSNTDDSSFDDTSDDSSSFDDSSSDNS